MGLKPTRDIVSPEGIIPVLAAQDTVGPLAKTVKDVAHSLSVIAEPAFDYTRDLGRSHAGELRIGVLRKPDDMVDKHKLEAFNDALARLRSTGVIIVDPVAIPGLEEYEDLSQAERSVVVDTEFKVDLEKFLSSLAVNPRNIRTLGQLIEAIKQDPRERFPEWNAEVMERADRTSIHSAIYSRIGLQVFRGRYGTVRHKSDIIARTQARAKLPARRGLESLESIPQPAIDEILHRFTASMVRNIDYQREPRRISHHRERFCPDDFYSGADISKLAGDSKTSYMAQAS